jgi:hypothetical protein
MFKLSLLHPRLIIDKFYSGLSLFSNIFIHYSFHFLTDSIFVWIDIIIWHNKNSVFWGMYV